MITTLSILSIILLVLIIAVFVFGVLRGKGKVFSKYENLTDKADVKILQTHKKIQNYSNKVLNNCNLNLKETIAWILKIVLDILHVVTRRVSIRISKLRSKYNSKKTIDSVPSSPSEFLREVGESRENK